MILAGNIDNNIENDINGDIILVSGDIYQYRGRRVPESAPRMM